MRRLPVFFLIDVSESMVGDPIKNVNEGIHKIISNLRGNPMALETAYISIIVFAGKAKTVIPLTELLSFNPPLLNIGGGTALGKAMNFLMDEIERQIKRTTYDTKGDWKPIVFLFTDGAPTDNVTSAITRWKSNFKNKANLVAISIGNQADTAVLKKITNNVFIFNNTDAKSYSDFFTWISASIESKSINVATAGDNDFQLPGFDQKIIQKEDIYRPKTDHDERFAILLARCQITKKPYLVKFIKESSEKYILDGAYTITEEYFSLSSKGESPTISTEYLDVLPACPECENSGVAYCSCGHLFCVGTENNNRCPWCEQYVKLQDSRGFDISGTQG